MSAQDRNTSDADKWENQKSGYKCKICHESILNGDIEASKQPDGTYICPLCQYDAEKLEKE